MKYMLEIEEAGKNRIKDLFENSNYFKGSTNNQIRIEFRLFGVTGDCELLEEYTESLLLVKSRMERSK